MMMIKWRQRIFIILLVFSLAISLFLKFHDFFAFFYQDFYISSSSAGTEVGGQVDLMLYGEDFQLIRQAIALPPDARVLVVRRYWIANYYLYPRRLYHFKATGATADQLSRFIVEHKIGWAAFAKEGVVNLVKVSTAGQGSVQ